MSRAPIYPDQPDARAIQRPDWQRDTDDAAPAQVVALAARRTFLEDARCGQLTDAADPAVMDQAWRR